MNEKDILKYCKYYKGEAQCPFNENDKDACFWWNGEQMFCENLKQDPGFYQRFLEMTELDPTKWPVPLNDPNIEEPQRVLLWYLEMLHCKWKPFDGCWCIVRY